MDQNSKFKLFASEGLEIQLFLSYQKIENFIEEFSDEEILSHEKNIDALAINLIEKYSPSDIEISFERDQIQIDTIYDKKLISNGFNEISINTLYIKYSFPITSGKELLTYDIENYSNRSIHTVEIEGDKLVYLYDTGLQKVEFSESENKVINEAILSIARDIKNQCDECSYIIKELNKKQINKTQQLLHSKLKNAKQNKLNTDKFNPF